MVYLRLTYVPTYVDEIECLHHCRHYDIPTFSCNHTYIRMLKCLHLTYYPRLDVAIMQTYNLNMTSAVLNSANLQP